MRDLWPTARGIRSAQRSCDRSERALERPSSHRPRWDCRAETRQRLGGRRSDRPESQAQPQSPGQAPSTADTRAVRGEWRSREQFGDQPRATVIVHEEDGTLAARSRSWA